MDNNNSIFKPFVSAYLLCTFIILAIIFLSYHFTLAASLAILSLLIFIILIIILGLFQPASKFLSFFAVIIAVGSFILLSFYTKCPVTQAYKFIIVLSFYFLLGYFPALYLSQDYFGSILISGLAIIIGSLLFNILSATSVIYLGVTNGGFIAFLVSLFFMVFCYIRKRKNDVDIWVHFKKKLLPQELEIVSVILLLLVTNAIVTNSHYPHGHRETYFEFAKLLLVNNFISFNNVPGFSSGGVHVVSLVVSPIWTRFINIDLGASIYFELLIGHIGLYICVYIFSRMLFKKHSYALGSLIFVAMLGELFTYFYGLKHLINHGKLWDFFPLNFDSWGTFTMYLRSRLSPLYFPWVHTNYIDSVKGYASILLSMYIIFKRNNDLPALIFGGLLMMAIAGSGEEYLLYTYLVFLFLYLLISRKTLKVKNIVIGTLIGLLLGLPVYFYLSLHKGGLNLVSQGTVYFRNLKDIGLYIYPNRKIPMDLVGLGYILLEFTIPAIIFIVLACQKSFFHNKKDNHVETRRFLFSFFLATLIMASAALFVSSTQTTNWNLNRFLNPFIFWLYFVGGAGFVYLVSERFKTRFIIVTLLMLLAIFPTIRLAYSYFVSGHERIISGISETRPPHKVSFLREN